MNLHDAIIIYIEDNVNNLKLIGYLLTNRIQVKEYYPQRSGQEFFSWFDSELGVIPDIILLDIQLPKQDGYTILDQIRQNHSFKHTKVIAITASVMKSDQDRLIKAGFDGLLAKPIRARQFEHQMSAIVRGEWVWDIQ